MNIEQLQKYLQYNIPNSELYDEFNKELISSIEDLKITTNLNEIVAIATNKKTKNDFLYLNAKPGKINFLIYNWNGNYKENIIIEYNNYKTTIIIKEQTDVVFSKTNNLCFTDIKIISKTYNNGELIEESKLLETLNYKDDEKNKVNYTIINRIDKTSAIKKEVNIDKNKKLVCYRLSNNYIEPYFNDISNNNNAFVTTYHNISTDQYNQLLNGKQKTIK